MKKNILIGLIVVLFSVDVYAKGRSSGGGSFGTNRDIVDKYPTKRITNNSNSIPGLRNGESMFIYAKVVVRTRNYFWLPHWKNGYAEISIKRGLGHPSGAFNVKRLSVMQVQKHSYRYNQMVRNEGVGWNYDIKFNYGIKLPFNRHLPTNFTISNGRYENNVGYVNSAYTIPNYFTQRRGIYKNNASFLRYSLRNPAAPVTVFFNVKFADNLGHAFSITNAWGGKDEDFHSFPTVTVGTF